MWLHLTGGPLDGCVTWLPRRSRVEVFLVGYVPPGATVKEFEAALSRTGAARSPRGRSALCLLASRASAARYSLCGGWQIWRRSLRYTFLDEQLLWVEDATDGPHLGLAKVPDYPPSD
jgi:hypothetical protein